MASVQLLPEAMALATVSREGRPSIRTVLLKDLDQEGFVFYTNYESQKAKELDPQSQRSIGFPLERVT